MIVKSNVEINGRTFIQTRSDSGLLIQKVGTDEKYSEAVDILESNFQYVETDKKTEEVSEDEATD